MLLLVNDAWAYKRTKSALDTFYDKMTKTTSVIYFKSSFVKQEYNKFS